MAKRTFEELSAEVEAEKKILSNMVESGQCTSEQLLKQSQKLDPLIVEVTIIKIVDRMIKDYDLRLIDGKISCDGWLAIGNKYDFKFFKENQPAFLRRLKELKEIESKAM